MYDDGYWVLNICFFNNVEL